MVSTDQRRQFESTLWRELMELLGSKRICTTAYYPSANGLIEWFHRQIKTSLKAQLQPTLWVDALPLVLLGIRTALKEDIHCSAAELVYVLPYACLVNSSILIPPYPLQIQQSMLLSSKLPWLS